MHDILCKTLHTVIIFEYDLIRIVISSYRYNMNSCVISKSHVRIFIFFKFEFEKKVRIIV